ncbi:ABC transporter substrate-binding protein, partial [Candidatus Parcubacteria bacterium]|nr:ABC transporter substrate-binding protein [Candidatus Parcubacteria bacterium]
MTTNWLKYVVFSFFYLVQSIILTPTLREGIVGQPTVISPLNTRPTEIDKTISNLVFRGLTKYDDRGQIVGDLAQDWEISEDGLTYTFHLLRNIRWHDRRKFTANDVLYTMSQAESLKMIASDKLDEYTVRFLLPDKFAPFLDLMRIGIVPQHLSGEMKPLRPIGTGLYKVLRVQTRGDKVESIVLGTNQNYPYKKLTFNFYDDEEKLLQAARLGEIDSFAAAPGFEWPTFGMTQFPILSQYYALFFNLDREVLQDQAVREAIASQLPRDQIAELTIQGEKKKLIAGPIGDPWISPEDNQPPQYINSFANPLDISLKLAFAPSGERQEIAEMIQTALKEIGVSLELELLDPEELTEKIAQEHDFDLVLLGQEVMRDPDRYSLWHSTQTGYPGLNITSFKSPRTDLALEKGRKTLDLEERRKHYS